MPANINKTDSGYSLTVNGISINFHSLLNLMKYARLLKFNVVHSLEVQIMKNQYQVIVGNIGTVYDGTNGFTAIKEYNSYIGLSKAPFGRASGETVTLFKNDEIYKEFIGSIDSQEYIDQFSCFYTLP